MPTLVNKGIEPICGWQWVYAHLHDLDGWQPIIELKSPGLILKISVKDHAILKEIMNPTLTRKQVK